jgi:hypothetical protein
MQRMIDDAEIRAPRTQLPVEAPVRPRHEVWQGRVGTAIAAIGIAALVIVVVVQLGLFHLPTAATRKKDARRGVRAVPGFNMVTGMRPGSAAIVSR